MTTQSKIERTELTGRVYFNQIAAASIANLQSITFTELTEMHDASVTSTTKDFVVEIKTRTINHDQYKTNIIKANKYNHLMSGVGEGFIPLYYNFYEDGVCLVWDLSKVKIAGKSVKNVRKTQMNDNSRMEDTMYLELNVSDARKYHYKKNFTPDELTVIIPEKKVVEDYDI